MPGKRQRNIEVLVGLGPNHDVIETKSYYCVAICNPFWDNATTFKMSIELFPLNIK